MFDDLSSSQSSLLNYLRGAEDEEEEEKPQSALAKYLSGLAMDQEYLSFSRKEEFNDSVNRGNPVFEFLQSTVESATREFIGLEPSETTKRFRADNPTSGIVSQLLGVGSTFAIPLAAPATTLRVASMIPGVARLATFGGRAAKLANPRLGQIYASGAAKQIAQFAPLELGRVVGAAAFGGPENALEVTKHALQDLVIFGGIFGGPGAALTALRPFSREVKAGLGKLQVRFGELKRTDTPQETLAKLLIIRNGEAYKGLSDDFKQTVDNLIGGGVYSNVTPGIPREADELVVGFKRLIRAQAVPEGKKALRRLKIEDIGGEGPKNIALLNKIMGPGGKVATSLRARRLIPGKDAHTFKQEGETPATTIINKITDKLGWSPGWETEVQFPTHVTADTAVASRQFLMAQMKTLQRVGMQDGRPVLLSKEAGPDGLYVMITSVPRQRAVPAAGRSTQGLIEQVEQMGNYRRTLQFRDADEYMIFKTTNPARFGSPDSRRFAQKVNAAHFRLNPKEIEISTAVDALPAMIDYKKFKTLLPHELELQTLPHAKIASRIAGLLSRDPAFAEDAALGFQAFKTKIAQFVQPGINRFRGNGELQARWQKVHFMTISGQARATKQWYGKETVGSKKSLYGLIFRHPEFAQEGIQGIARAAKKNPKAWSEFYEAVVQGFSPAKAKSLGYRPEAIKLLKRLDDVDTQYIDWIKEAENFAGLDKAERLAPRKFHFMISRLLRGSHRVPIYAEGDDGIKHIAWYADGYTKASAYKRANLLVEGMTAKAKASGEGDLKLILEAETTLWPRATDFMSEMGLVKHINEGNRATKIARQTWYSMTVKPAVQPGRFAPRTGKVLIDIPDVDELERIVFTNMLASENYLVQTVFKEMEKESLLSIGKNYPGLTKVFNESVDAVAGRKGELLKVVDDAIDRFVTTAIPGVDSAARLVRQVNRAVFNMTLTWADLGFAALNTLQPIQTSMSEVAYLLGAPPERLAYAYSGALVMGRDNVPRYMSYLEPMKVLGKAFKSLGNPSKEEMDDLFWALETGVIRPKFVEAFAGQKSRVLGEFKDIRLGKEGGFERAWDYMLTLNEYLPGKSEELSRGMAFLMARNIGKDFFNLQKDELRQFASIFTDRTMFLYTSADRPRVITGTFGTLFGLFKNWPMHYMSHLASYTGEATKGNIAPLMFMGLGTGLVGGATAVPFYGAIDQLSRMVADQGFADYAYSALGMGDDRDVLDAAFYGLPTMAGITMSGRAAVPSADLVRDLTSMYNVASLDRAFALGSAVGEGIATAREGENPFSNQKVTDKLWRALAPRSIYRWVQASGDRGYRSLNTGNTIISDVSLPKRLSYAFGLTPLDFEKSSVITEEATFKVENYRRELGLVGELLAQALENNDINAIRRLAIVAVNKGLPVESVYKSAYTRLSKRNSDLNERKFKVGVTRALESNFFGLR